jgi:hypothetical protein
VEEINEQGEEMSSRGLDLLKEEELRLKQELSEIRADIAKLEGSTSGRPKAKKEFSGVSDRAAREVAEAIRSHNGNGVPIGTLIDQIGKSRTYVREAARKAINIFPDIIRYKELDAKEFYYKAKQVTTEATE